MEPNEICDIFIKLVKEGKVTSPYDSYLLGKQENHCDILHMEFYLWYNEYVSEINHPPTYFECYLHGLL